MEIAIMGSVGCGLMWGWLLVAVGGRGRRPAVEGVAAGLATGLLLGETFFLATGRATALFLGAAAVAFLLHLAWREELLSHHKTSDS